MKLNFNIDYRVQWGESLYICGNIPTLGDNDLDKAVRMDVDGPEHWHSELELPDDIKTFDYFYIVKNNNSQIRHEWGKPHTFTAADKVKDYDIFDHWQDMPADKPFYSSAFTDCIFRRSKQSRKLVPRCGFVQIRVEAPMIVSGQSVAVCGSCDALGNWQPAKAVKMNDAAFPVWTVNIPAKNLTPQAEFKFIIIDNATGALIAWENGNNRYLNITPHPDAATIISGLRLRNPLPLWKGAGTAIPVFSLRSDKDFGIGDFYDMFEMIDWCAETGQTFLQILPINDTTMTHTWTDSYPYNANSTFALHPMYLRLSELGRLKDHERQAYYDKLAAELNNLKEIDYERVSQAKFALARELFAQEGKRVKATKAYKDFVARNIGWLKPYAAFCALRDKFSTPDYSKWGKYARYTPAVADKVTKESAIEIDFAYYLQFNLDKQLRQVRDYANSKGVAIKGDIPIGISRTSADAWINPRLFNLDCQAGAPPDDFSIVGQNWGFPTYNWDEMSRDGYAWWKSRFKKMAEYFDAYRIDHVLGFFRIWEIPVKASNGLLGIFNPALPFSPDELADKYGFHIDIARQAKSFSDLNNDILFIEDPRQSGKYHPRISAQQTDVYRSLSDVERHNFDRLYYDFFYHRHNHFWYEKAMAKLPPLIDATDMLVCAEDLGMIPACVPHVMDRLQILALEVQRMPKETGTPFGHPAKYPYLSVCTTSSHDTSGIRSWWEEDLQLTQQYFNQWLHHNGRAPQTAEPWICDQIIDTHLKSPSILCILPLQDWLSVNRTLRRDNPDEERINVPANSRNYWRYRMHLTLAQLRADKDFSAYLRSKIHTSAR